MSFSFRVAVIMFLFAPATLVSQNKKKESPYYSWFDQLITIENTALFNGIEFKEKYRFLNDQTNYFKSPKFLSGSIIYDSQLFNNVLLKYDVYKHEIIVRLQNRKGEYSELTLLKNKIDQFTISDLKFKKIKDAQSGFIVMDGFYELSLQNEVLTYYKKHQKFKREIYFERRLYPEFFHAKTKHIINYKNHYYLIEDKKEISDIFPLQKKKIYNFYRVHRSIRKSTPDVFILELLKEISSFIKTENNIE